MASTPVKICDATDATCAPSLAAPADNETNSATVPRTGVYNFVFDGATWDRWTGLVAATQSGTWSFLGTKSNNAGAPGASNLGTLPAVAMAGGPSYTEGNQVALSTDLSGNLRASALATQLGTWTVQQGTPPWSVAGSVAHDAVGTGVNTFLQGGYASAAAPADVSADGDAVRSWYLRNGSQVIQPAFAGVLWSTGSGVSGTGTPRMTL